MSEAAGAALAEQVRRAVREIPDFPKPGILFKDITPLLLDSSLFARTIDELAAPFRRRGITHVAAIESRGFIFGAPVALALEASFVPLRKPGKLPGVTVREEYALEYGSDALEMHADAIGQPAVVLIVDDLLATGGTAAAACRLVERAGGTVAACVFVVELTFLSGRARLPAHRIESLVAY